MTAAGAAGALMLAVLGLARMAMQPQMSLLYAGLEDAAAGEVVAALDRQGVPYEVRNGAIFVPDARRDALRMGLAGEGLPRNTTQGYELLDGLSGFGTTAQMFDAAYWRAKEGELARTITAHPSVRAARVHISTTGTNPFRRDVKPAASVTITAAAGEINAGHARALRFLVASAVPGLNSGDVAVIDADGTMIAAKDASAADSPDARAEALRRKVTRLLAAHVGRGNAVVEVAVDTVTRRESVRERRLEPESRVAISSDVEERSSQESGTSGSVTVASNLPDGNAAGPPETAESTETRERVNYEVSQIEREITRLPGAIKRLSVAVLVGGTPAAGGDSEFRPRSDDELAALRDLVASAVGFDEARGDVITIRSLPFDPSVPNGTPPSRGPLARLGLDLMGLIQAGLLALVAVILGLFVLRPMLLRPVPASLGQLAAPSPEDSTAGAGRHADAAKTALTGEIAEGGFDADRLSLVGDAPDGTSAAPPEHAEGVPPEDPVERLRLLIGQRQEETVEILRNWLETDEENA